MANFLDSLGLGGGTDVYIAISSNNIMEMCVPEKGKGTIKAYAKTSLAYNDAAREIADYEEFKTKVQELFNECGISPQKTNIHLGLPLVWFGHNDDIQLTYDDEAIKNIVIGDLEQTFIFKRKEPVPYWFDALTPDNSTSRKVFYTAMQEEAITDIKEALKSIGANLVSIDCSIFSYLRALYATGRTTTQVDTNNYSWNFMIIGSNGFQMFGMQNDKMTEFYEEPIILNSLESDDAYSQVANAAQIAMLSSAANALVILSETDLISASVLSQQLQFSGEIIVVENNKFRTEPIAEICYTLPEEKQLDVSMHIIGLFAGVGMLPWGANFVDEDEEDVIEIPLTADKIIKLTPKKALKYSIIFLLATAIPLLLIFGITTAMSNNSTSKTQELNNQLNEVTNQLSAYEQKNDTNFNPISETERVLKNNRIKIMSYAALGESIPKDLYLTYFMTGDDGYIDIQGCANSVEDVYIFFQNLKDSLVESKLRLNKLDLKAGSLDSVIDSNVSTIDTAPYVFEITNMSDSQLANFIKALNSETGDSQQNNSNSNSNSMQPQSQPKEQLPPPPTN